MPIIQFDESDKLRAVTAEAGWYPAIVKAIDMKSSKSESSINFWTEFEITEGKFKGKEVKCCFNTKTNASSLLGGAQFRPHSDMLQLYAAINNVNLDEVPLNFNTDDLLVKGFDLQISLDMAEGVPVNTTGMFLPAGKATAAGSKQVSF